MLFLLKTNARVSIQTSLIRFRSASLQVGKMSTQILMSKLPHPISDLVFKATQDASYFGKSEKEKVEVLQWLDKVAGGIVMGPSYAEVGLLYIHEDFKMCFRN